MTAMKKRASPPTLWLGLQLILWLSVLACTLALIGIGSRSPSPAALVEVPFSGTPKIAFLFLARSNLPLDFLWHAFFQNAEEDKYSIYVHSEPGFVFDRTTTRSPFFFGRQIQDSIKVVWGEATMIEAERLLFAAALKDPANRRFALISDSCVPLYNFSHIYNYVMSSSKSFVDSFLDKRERRYNPKMFPTIPKDRWRKGSQWTILVRKHAQIVVADTVVFPEFRRFCKRRIEPVLGGKQNHKEAAQKEHNCIPDEHYMQTLLSNINHIYYETEYRTEWCQCNVIFVPCFLFARKFSRSAAMRILKEGLIGPFDAGAVLFTSS
ncbi:glycosyltransferase BC10-like isoform X2 [Musa acuminata AAA Group]|uniref:glycosyltransferase BC10-like isoform X2 n=1 Tax=Musa acuminata AAA Group TaxID=214697 RepID=UPI0031D895D0